MKKNNSLPKEPYKRIFLIFTILAGLVLNLFLIQTIVLYNTKAATQVVNIYFEPPSVPIPPDSSFKLMLDPKSQSISFVRVGLFFDTTKITLTDEIVVNSGQLTTLEGPTSMSEANSTGYIEMVLVQNPGDPAPNSTFEIATLPFTYVDPDVSQTTYVSIVDEETQVVDTNSNDLEFNNEYGEVVLNGGVKAIGGSGFKSMFSDLQQGDCNEGYFDSAIGCIPILDSAKLAAFLLNWGIGIAGGIAIVLIVYAGYMTTTSSGDPRRLQAGKELLTAAIAGLTLMVFAAYILRVIGLDILQLPGF